MTQRTKTQGLFTEKVRYNFPSNQFEVVLQQQIVLFHLCRNNECRLLENTSAAAFPYSVRIGHRDAEMETNVTQKWKQKYRQNATVTLCLATVAIPFHRNLKCTHHPSSR